VSSDYFRVLGAAPGIGRFSGRECCRGKSGSCGQLLVLATAAQSETLALILRRSFTLVLIAIVAGMAGAIEARGCSQRCGVSASDVATYGAVVLLLALAALAASYMPARRAMNVDPMIALPHE